MTDLLLRILLCLILDDIDFLALAVLNNSTLNYSTVNNRGSCLKACLGRNCNDLVKYDLCTLFAVKLLNEDNVLLRYFVLLSAGLDNCKHEKHLSFMKSRYDGGIALLFKARFACAKLNFKSTKLRT